jgi:Tfp pilus assembly protein FimT
MLIIGVLTLLAVPALSSLSNSGNVNAAAGGVSLLLDQARTYAMAHNTYVWVGFCQNTATQQLMVGVVAGKTGQSSDANSGSGFYIPISKLQTYNQLELSSSISALPNTGLSSLATAADDISQCQPNVIGSFQQPVGGTNVNFNSDVLEFTPSGEAKLGTNDGSHWIQIGLQPVRGANATSPNVAVLQVATLTGLVNVFRP